MIMFALVLHILWMIGLLLDSSSQWITAMAVTQQIAPRQVALILGGVSVSALIGIGYSANRFVTLVLLLPQQFILYLSALGALQAILLQQYGDGVPRPFWFICADQAPSLLLSGFHTVALLHFCGLWPRQGRRVQKEWYRGHVISSLASYRDPHDGEPG